MGRLWRWRRLGPRGLWRNRLPQGLKPWAVLILDGTTKVVPFPRPLWLVWNSNASIFCYCESWIPGDFPQESIGVRKVA
jgi:hypothetical protein